MCVLTAFTSLIMLAPMRSAHQARKIAEFERLMKPHLPDDARGAEACRALSRRLERPTPAAPKPSWRIFRRPNEARLVDEAGHAANRLFEDARQATRSGGDAGARALATLTDFYASLGAYPGEGGRILKRAGAIVGTTTLPLLLIAAGIYVAQFPELCGAAPDLFGGHGAHVLAGTGVAGLAGLLGLIARPNGSAWLTDVGTAEADQVAGAQKAEQRFWQVLAVRWNEDPELEALTGASSHDVADQLLRRMDSPRGELLKSCEAMFMTKPDCAKCAGY